MVRSALAVLAALIAGAAAPPQQNTASGTAGRTVLFDFAHNNGPGRDANTGVMAALRSEGYGVRSLTEPFTGELLRDVGVVVTASPLADANALRFSSATDINVAVAERWRLPVPSAFAAEEIDAVATWVEQGGGVLIVADHFPMPGALGALLSRFGIEVSNGFAVDASRLPSLPVGEGPPLGAAGELVFDRAAGTLADHPVTNGRGGSERVNRVGTFFGGAFHLPDSAESLLILGPSAVSLLPDVAWEFSEATPRQNVAGWSQGGLLRFGSGRVAVFGDLGILVTDAVFAETHPDMQNLRLLLNVTRWLSEGRGP